MKELLTGAIAAVLIIAIGISGAMYGCQQVTGGQRDFVRDCLAHGGSVVAMDQCIVFGRTP